MVSAPSYLVCFEAIENFHVIDPQSRKASAMHVSLLEKTSSHGHKSQRRADGILGGYDGMVVSSIAENASAVPQVSKTARHSGRGCAPWSLVTFVGKDKLVLTPMVALLPCAGRAQPHHSS